EIELSLVPLIKFWEREIANPHSLRGTLGRTIQAALREAPELSGPIHDVAVLTRHQDLVEALMAVVFPPASWHQAYGATLVPFQLRSLYSTPSCERELMGTEGQLSGRLNIDWTTMGRFRLLNAFSLVLRRIWGIEFPVDYPLIWSAEDRETHL